MVEPGREANSGAFRCDERECRAMDSDMKRMQRLGLAGDIDKHPVGSKLTPAAREKAIDFAQKTMTTNNVDYGTATKLGIDHVTSDVFKKE